MRGRIALATGVTAVAVLPAVSLVGPTVGPVGADPVVQVPGLAMRQVVTGVRSPVAARVSADGRIFVASKRGEIQMFDGAGDTSPVPAVDLFVESHSAGDRGVIGMELDPEFTTGRPYLYALYTYNKDPFGDATVPRWGSNGTDACPDPPGTTIDGCTVTARLVRYTVGDDGIGVPGSRIILLDGASERTGGWCVQYTHSIGTVAFGPDGALYVGAGDGATARAVDYGQLGGSRADSPTPANPCSDEPGGRGTELSPATSHGGALRSQAVRAATADGFVSWDGAILRVDPDTGLPLPSNPLVGNGRAGDDRIVAYGLRNPFRFAFRPGTDELWLGDVGWTRFEEINAFRTGPDQDTVPNFGWPCYEGTGRQGAYDSADIGLCESLYGTPTSSLGGVSSPLASAVFSYPRQGEQPAPGCASSGGNSVTGGQFLTGPAWPDSIRDGYVFADYARGCIAVLPPGADGEPDVTRPTALVTGTAAVDIQLGPDGNLYWVDIVTGSLNRLESTTGANLPPVASFTATPASGPVPLAVRFDASRSRDPNPDDSLSYAWDLDGDGACDDATGLVADRTYATRGAVAVRLCVSDGVGGTEAHTVVIHPGESPPLITSLTSDAGPDGWSVDDRINFTGTATEHTGEELPDSALGWAFDVRHCETEDDASCHTHPYAEHTGASVSLVAPDHEHYAFVRASLTVTGSNGLTSTRTLESRPRVSTVALATRPTGMTVTNGLVTGTSPVTARYLHLGNGQLLVPRLASVDGRKYRFAGWADGSTEGTRREFRTPGGSSQFVAEYQLDRPPAVSEITVRPRSVPALPATLSVRARATDDDGVVSVRARLIAPRGRVFSNLLARESGTTTDGIWAGTLRLPRTAAAGTYRTRVVAIDTAGGRHRAPGPRITVSR